MAGETSRIRDMVSAFIRPDMMGLDLGFGGDALWPTSIAVDLERPYTSKGGDPQHLKGDARQLYWFQSGSLDYVYSSHLLEDFPPEQTAEILAEWVRVLKRGGYLALYLPNELRFLEHCAKTGQPGNDAHQCIDMSLGYMRPIVESCGLEVTFEHDEPEGYGFLIIARKR